MWGILVYQPWFPVNIRLLSPFLGVSTVVLPIYIYISSCGYFFGLSKRSNSDHLKFSIHAVLVGPVENECLFMLSSVFMFPQ